MIIVHHLENSRSQRILWLLEELGVPYEVKRYARNPIRAPNAKNSRSAKTATMPANPATNQVAPHQTAVATAGMSTAAVSVRTCIPEFM